MSIAALRPRSATEIVDAAFQIFRAHYAPMVTCAALAYLPLLALRLLSGDPMRFLTSGSTTVTGAEGAFVRTGVIGMLGSWLTFSLIGAVLVVCTSQAYLGDEVSVSAAVRRVLPQLPKVLMASLLRFMLMGIAFLFLFLPALYVGARYFAVSTAIILEDWSFLGGFSRSTELSRGRKWHVLNTLGLVVLIYWVLVIGVSAAASLFGNFVLQTVISSVVTVMVYPVISIVETLLYYDARIQSEGLDIEMMAEALSPASTV
jgi:hypothetical protein